MLHRLRLAADNDALVSASFAICGLKAPQAVGDHMASGASALAAHSVIASLVNPATRDMRIKCGRPSFVVCTAATKGALLGDPRPRFSPVHSPPRYASSTSTRTSSLRVSSRRYIVCNSLCLISQAVL